MMKLSEMRLIGETAAGGSVTVTAEHPVFGLLYAVEWVDGDLADGGQGVLSCTLTHSAVDYTLLTLANPLANADAWYYPRVLVHSEAGAALTGTSGGDRTMPVINGVLSLAITSGGATKTGGCIVYFYE